MKWYLSILTAVLVIACSPPSVPNPSSYGGAKVSLSLGYGSCSGVHIGGNYILTASHCVEAAERYKKPILVNKWEVPPTLMWNNKEYDVALLQMTDESFAHPSAKLVCATPKIGEDLVVVGDPLGETDIYTFGKVASDTKKDRHLWGRFIFGNVAAAPGNSGGPVFRLDGSLVGILVGGFNPFTPMSIVVPSEVICELMGKKIATPE